MMRLLVLKCVYYVTPVLNMTMQVHNNCDYIPPIVFLFYLEQANQSGRYSVGHHVYQKAVPKHLKSLFHCNTFITKLTHIKIKLRNILKS